MTPTTRHPIHHKFKVDEYLVKEYAHWTLSVRYDVATLGGCVAITKENHTHLRELSADEWTEFGELCKDFENATKKAFKAEKWNYLCLMMVDEHTHFHLLPRYSSPREFAGKEWEDRWWPRPTGSEKVTANHGEIIAVRDELKKSI